MILTKNGNLMKFASGAAVNAIIPPDPLNPLGLPPFTMRCKFASGVTPVPRTSSDVWDSAVLVDSVENIWDIIRNNTSWHWTMFDQQDLLEVLGANTTDITDMGATFRNCISLERIALFDTSNVTIMGGNSEGEGMFNSCRSLKTVPLFNTRNVTTMRNMFRGSFMYSEIMQLEEVPLFDTSSCTDMRRMFYYCKNVKSGALALYQQASSQAIPPTDHTGCFLNCGSDTTTGAAELAQIPSDWK